MLSQAEVVGQRYCLHSISTDIDRGFSVRNWWQKSCCKLGHHPQLRELCSSSGSAHRRPRRGTSQAGSRPLDISQQPTISSCFLHFRRLRVASISSSGVSSHFTSRASLSLIRPTSVCHCVTGLATPRNAARTPKKTRGVYGPIDGRFPQRHAAQLHLHLGVAAAASCFRVVDRVARWSLGIGGAATRSVPVLRAVREQVLRFWC